MVSRGGPDLGTTGPAVVVKQALTFGVCGVLSGGCGTDLHIARVNSPLCEHQGPIQRIEIAEIDSNRWNYSLLDSYASFQHTG